MKDIFINKNFVLPYKSSTYALNQAECIKEMISEEYQPFLLSHYENMLSKYIYIESKKVFNQTDSNEEETREEEDNNRYFINPNNLNKKPTKFNNSCESKSENQLNVKQNKKSKDLCLDLNQDLSNNTTIEKLKSNKIKFISKKRKNSESQNTFESSETKNDISLNIKYQNQNIKLKKVNSSIDLSKNKNNKKYKFRVDYLIKAFKVSVFQNLTKELNDLLAICNLPYDLKKYQIHKPNNKYFTSNAKIKDNLKFLEMFIKDIYSNDIYSNAINNEKHKVNHLQIKNEEFFDKLMKYIELNNNNISDNLKKINKYLNMTMEEYIDFYYETDSFKNFCKDDKIKFYEEEFFNEKKFSFLEKNKEKINGFCKLIRNIQ